MRIIRDPERTRDMPPGAPHDVRTTSAAPISGVPPVDPVPGGGDVNLVVILLDDGGAEWFDWSGLAEPKSGFIRHPRLTEMRGRGVTFTRAYACPICAPSRARLWSGQYGFDAGLGGNPTDVEDFAFCGGGAPIADWQNPLPIARKLLPRLLRIGRDGADDLPSLADYTYAQACFGKTHLHSHEGRETWPTDHGIGRYVGCQPNAGVLPHGDPNTGHFHFTEISQVAGGAPTSKIWGAPGQWPAGGPYVAYDPSARPDAAWDAFTVYRNAIQWINSRTTPFLALVNFNPPHAPFEVPPFLAPDDVGHMPPGGVFEVVSSTTRDELTQLEGGAKGPGFRPMTAASARRIYKANFEAIDTLIGKLWDRMEPTRRAKTVFVTIGDNGTVANVIDAPYQGSHAKRTPYEQGARVPCVVWGPPSVITAPGRTSDHLVHVVDLMPTLLELAKCPPGVWNPGGTRTVRGRSFVRVLRDPNAPSARDHVFNEIFLPLDGSLPGPVPIDPSTWVKTYTDGTHKIVERPGGVWEFYRIDATIQPASGVAGYFESREDDLYPLVDQPGQEALTATFYALQSALEALVAS